MDGSAISGAVPDIFRAVHHNGGPLQLHIVNRSEYTGMREGIEVKSKDDRS